MMGQKRVLFEVAKAIKGAGYPQEWNDTEYYYTENGELKRSDDYEGNSIEDIMYNQRHAIPAPFVCDVWLWLWREKGIKIILNLPAEKIGAMIISDCYYIGSKVSSDPEEAIEAAIKFIVDNGLLK